jgi:phosphoenolpyruvate-protein kinase (PTS system EI component)
MPAERWISDNEPSARRRHLRRGHAGHGAQITHAVIVSRELGIPCVVSVAGATSRIPDGALVEVDGSLGTVTLT